MSKVSSWGRLSAFDHELVVPSSTASVPPALAASPLPGLPLGNARSYGDECLNPGGTLWSSRRLDRFLAFDPETGHLTCEAGVLLRDIQQAFVPRGWMLPVVPGTELITVGGAIANDVHGKNHHVEGTFGDQIISFDLARTDALVTHCSRTENADLFAATIGGMGLTGFITTAELRLRRIPGPWLDAETVPYEGVDEFFALSDFSEAGWEHTVSWIDCLSGSKGRGLFLRARPAADQSGTPRDKKSKAMPIVPPVSLVNGLSLRPFNFAYYTANAMKRGIQRVHYRSYHHPLDSLHHWNRMYGPSGFYQYQSVVPRPVARDATVEMLQAIAKSGEGSFLAVLKNFGDKPSVGLMSFPMPGATLALDFPNRGERTLALFARLDAIVAEAGGRLYTAKDARMPKDLFVSGYPNLPQFLQHRDRGISSALSRRLMGY